MTDRDRLREFGQLMRQLAGASRPESRIGKHLLNLDLYDVWRHVHDNPEKLRAAVVDGQQNRAPSPRATDDSSFSNSAAV